MAALFVCAAWPTSVAAEESTSEATSEESSEDSISDVEKSLSLAQTAYHAGEWGSAKKAYRKAYRNASDESALKVQAALGLSSIEWEQGEYRAARKHVESALNLAQQLELDEAIGQLLLTLGHIQASQGELGQAEQTLARCISLAATQNDAVFGPLCRLNHRMVRKLQGKDIGSERIYKQALETLKSVDTPMTVGMSLAKTADLYSKSGKFGKALSLIDEAETQYEKAASEPAQARIRLDRARLLQEMGRWNAARNQLAGLAQTFGKMGSKPALVDTYGLMGDDARHRGQTDRAAKYYSKALSYAKSAGSPQMIAKVQVSLCELSTKTIGKCRAAISTLKGLNMPLLRARAEAAVGRKLQQRGKLKKAREAMLSAVEILDTQVAESVVPKSMRAANLSNLCQIEAREQLTGAFSRCRDAVRAIEALEGERPQMLALTRYALGTAAIYEGSPKTGVEHLTEAANSFEALDGNGRNAANAWLRAGGALKEAKRYERATDVFEKGLAALGDGKRDRALRIELRTQLAQVLAERQRWEDAAGVLEELIADAETAGKPGTGAWAYSLLARTLVKRGDDSGAKKALKEGIDLAKRAGDKQLATSMKDDLSQFE